MTEPTPTSQTSASPYQAPTAEPALVGDAPGVDATFGQRAIAYIIDVVVVSALSIAFMLAGFVLGMASETLGSLFSGVGSFVGLAYLVCRDIIPIWPEGGLGKKAMGIRAVKEDGKSLKDDMASGILRNVIFVIPFVGLIEAVVLFIRKDEHPLRRLADDWFKTRVIKNS